MKQITIENKTIQIPDDRYDELVKEFCKRCEQSSVVMLSNPVQYTCIKCNKTWRDGDETPICDKQEFCGSKRWKPVEGEYVYIVHPFGEVQVASWSVGAAFHNHLYRTGNCFRTKEEAEAKLAYINALAEINEYIAENEGKYAKDNYGINYVIVQDSETLYGFDTNAWKGGTPLCSLTFESKQLALDLIANQSHNLRVVAGINK